MLICFQKQARKKMVAVGIPLTREQMCDRYIIPDPFLVNKSVLRSWGYSLLWQENVSQIRRFAELNQFLVAKGHTPKVKKPNGGKAWISDDTLNFWETSLDIRVREEGRRKSATIRELLPQHIERLDLAYIAKYLFGISFKDQRQMIRQRISLRDRYPLLQDIAL